MTAMIFLRALYSLPLVLAFPLLAAPQRPPNVVVIFTDDQGYGDISCFGGKDLSTPNLDRMAQEGRKFTSFHVSSPVCSASRSSLMTGRLPSRTGIHGALGPKAPGGLAADEVTLAELVKQKSYATAMIGKWHLGRPANFLPQSQGFDVYFGIPYSSDMWPKHPENPTVYPPLPLIEGTEVKEILDDQTDLLHRFTTRACEFIQTNQEKPFLLYFAPQLPHVPLFTRREFRGRTERGFYGDVIAEIDDSVGAILSTLKTTGIDSDTLVIFTSDNGPWLSYGEHSGSAGPLREGKGTSWEGGIRVPCIMRWPGKIPADTTCSETLMSVDIFPTVAAITGVSLPDRKLDGGNILPLLTGDTNAKLPVDYYPVYYGENELQAILSGSWKLVLPHRYRTLESAETKATGGIPGKYKMVSQTTPALYHLTDDIGEARDVSAQYPEVLARLQGYAEKARAELGDGLAGRKPGSGFEK